MQQESVQLTPVVSQCYIVEVRKCYLDAGGVTIPYHAARKRHIDASHNTIVSKGHNDVDGVTIRLYHFQ